MKKELAQLTKAEEEVMQIIWELGPCLVRDIINRLGQPDIPHSTVSSVVRILEKKKFVSHKAYGKTYEYRAEISKEEYARQNIRSFIGKYFAGSTSRLVSFLVEEDNLNLRELNELMEQLAKSKK